MFPGPVFTAELLTSARRTRHYVLRSLYGAVLLFFVWQNMVRLLEWDSVAVSGEFSLQQLATLGRRLFVTLATVQSISILLLTPALVGGVIAEEKQRKTLHYLLASRLSSGEIVVGKLAARLLHLGVFLAIGLPVTSLLSLFGGVDPAEVLLVFAGTVTTTFFLSALAILVSTQARRPREAITIVYLLEIVWFFGPSILGWVLPSVGPFWNAVYQAIKPVLDWIGPTSPLSLLPSRVGSASAPWEPVLWMMGLQTAYGVLFVVLAVARLRPRFRNESDAGGRGWLRLLNRRRRFFPRPECGDDPMLWKERYVTRSTFLMQLVSIVVGIGVLALVSYLTFIFAKPAFIELASYDYGAPGVERARGEFNVCLRIMCALLYCLGAVQVAAAASSGLTSEREEDTWISLISTPLRGTEIIRAKIFGALWSRRWLGAMILSLWLLGAAAGAVHPIGLVFVAVETTVFFWFAAALGTCYSLGARTSGRALLATIATLIFVNGAYLMCCLPVWSMSFVVTFGVSPVIEGISLLSYEDVRTFFGHSWAPGRGGEAGEAALACLLGTLFYAIAAAALTQSTISRFADAAGRPRYSRGLEGLRMFEAGDDARKPEVPSKKPDLDEEPDPA